MVQTGTGTLPSYAETLPRTPEAAGYARRLVALVLTVWDMNEVRDAAEMVVSELLANAVQHARCESVRLTVTRLSDSRVQVSVVDRSRAHPRRRAADSIEEPGRGLGIVDALAQGGGGSIRWRGGSACGPTWK
ncbi:ATP-binding protein [Streptomyces sp. NPDC002125]